MTTYETNYEETKEVYSHIFDLPEVIARIVVSYLYPSIFEAKLIKADDPEDEKIINFTPQEIDDDYLLWDTNDLTFNMCFTPKDIDAQHIEYTLEKNDLEYFPFIYCFNKTKPIIEDIFTLAWDTFNLGGYFYDIDPYDPHNHVIHTCLYEWGPLYVLICWTRSSQ
jgi:hypothetical protein